MGEHGYASFTREDREDAKRRRPEGTLEGYAAERGLEYRGRGLAVHVLVDGGIRSHFQPVADA